MLCVIDFIPMGPSGSCGTAPPPPPPPDELEFTHIVAGAVHVVPTVHGDVQRMHLGPAVRRARLGEVTWRAEAEVRTPACFSPREEMRKHFRELSLCSCLSIFSSLQNHSKDKQLQFVL